MENKVSNFKALYRQNGKLYKEKLLQKRHTVRLSA